MKKITHLWPEGTRKALTLSYDDGVCQDIRLVETFNKYKLKATFNLNSGIQTENNFWINKGKLIKRMDIDVIEKLYRGHEVAVHSLTHPHLEDMPKELLITEIAEDRKNLERVFGYPVRGMAYPFGTYNDTVIDVLKVCGIEYSRTVKQHERFGLPANYLEWHPTCHHKNPKLMELTKAFIENNFGAMSLFYVWGHSYEFDVDENWEVIEEFCQTVGNKEDIWYATNIEIVDYMNALKNLRFSAECSMVYNPSALSVWISVDGKETMVKPGDYLNI
jgi:peptidoglycan-N-acetylglucosamine deacetylase